MTMEKNSKAETFAKATCQMECARSVSLCDRKTSSTCRRRPAAQKENDKKKTSQVALQHREVPSVFTILIYGLIYFPN